MSTYWTLVYAGTEKSFQDWGFTDPKLRLISQGQSTFTVRIPGVTNLVAAPPIPFEGAVVIWRNRTLSGGAYSGGSIVFQGKQVTRRGSANSDSPADTLVFGDAWYDLENLVFQQQWNYGSAPNTAYFARLNLFQRYDLVTGVSAATNGIGIINITLVAPLTLATGDYVTVLGLAGVNAPAQVTVTDTTHFSIPGHLTSAYGGGGQVWPDNQRITNGVQMQQIINFANAAGVAIQVGTIDLAYTLPIYPVKAVSCATALQICIKPQPDAAAWIDYSTTPPSFNCRARANLTAAMLPYADGGRHSTSEITPRYDLQPPAVVLQYQKTSTISGQTYTDFGTDAYPLLSTGLAVRSLVVPIDLRGASRQSVSVLVQANALPNLPSGDAPSIAWWQLKKQEMAGYGSLSMVAASLSVVDDSGNNLTSTWAASLPNEYVKGEILAWMGVNVVQVTVSAQFTYLEKDPSNRTWHAVGTSNPHRISVRVKLTNSPAGKIPYSAVQSSDPGELAPAGLAQQIYTSLQTLQYEGQHTILDAGLSVGSTLVGPRHKLQISGGAAAWATMNATIQVVDFDFFYNRCVINFGPAKHIAPGDLEELLQFWRWRTVYDNPNLRISGLQSQTQGAQIGGDTAAENTTQGNAPPEILRVQAGPAATTVTIQHDAVGKSISCQTLNAANAVVASTSGFVLGIADLEPDGIKRTASFQLFKWRDATDCLVHQAYVLMTTPEPG